MDAHVFRRLGTTVAQVLHKARIERIHEPVPGVTAFSLYLAGQKWCLLFRGHRSTPLLFLTNKSPFANPAFPPASVMRLRKYAAGRILGEARLNWVDRQLAFALPGPENAPGNWLLLDCKYGPAIVSQLPESFAEEPVWPEVAAIPSLIHPVDNAAPWEQFRILTPPLRRTLASLESEDAAALLVDLEDGSGDLFWYGPRAHPHSVSAWPLSAEQEGPANRTETVTSAEPQALFPMLEAMQLPILLADAQTLAATPAVKRDKSTIKKRNRLLDKLENERKRLEAMLALGDDARILQAHLWNLPPDAQQETICLPMNPEDPEGAYRTIALSPLMTVTENMQTMFRKAAKATRGLAMLEQRIALAREMPVHTPPPETGKKHQTGKKDHGKKPLFSPSLIQEFISSDGFCLWRGRNAEGNRALLKLARPFDLWFHVEDGPSAHLLVRRDHSAQEVPEQTLRESAVLVGLKSWRRDDPKAPVMIALAKHVQPIKGAAPGTVRVQERLQTLLVALDETMEHTLRPVRTTLDS